MTPAPVRRSGGLWTAAGSEHPGGTVHRPLQLHGEGPFWDAANGRLLLVDMLAGAVVEVGAEGGTQRRKVAEVAAALRARRGCGYVLATKNRFVLLGGDLTEETVLPPVFTDPRLRINDGGCDPQGRFYCGTMAYDEARTLASLTSAMPVSIPSPQRRRRAPASVSASLTCAPHSPLRSFPIRTPSDATMVRTRSGRRRPGRGSCGQPRPRAARRMPRSPRRAGGGRR
jgi:hypothetical protein